MSCSQLPAPYNNLALTYLYLGLYGKALRFARRAVSLAREHSGPVQPGGIPGKPGALRGWPTRERARRRLQRVPAARAASGPISSPFAALGLGQLGPGAKAPARSSPAARKSQRRL